MLFFYNSISKIYNKYYTVPVHFEERVKNTNGLNPLRKNGKFVLPELKCLNPENLV